MGDNSSSADHYSPAPEIGWQAGPLTRGAASILWNCISVVILITWTSFHPPVGINWRQRIPTTITATLIPQLSYLVAARDFHTAVRLDRAFKSHQDRLEWREGWNMTKSFLVVKGGIRALPHQIPLSSDSSSAQSVNMTTDETTDITAEEAAHDTAHDTAYETADETADEIVDWDTFFVLAVAGRIRYEDFPTTDEINDHSKADWFSKCATLAQLSWFLLNMYCRTLSPTCDISVVEVLVFDWVSFGVMAAVLWWECPKNINRCYCIPVHDHSIPDEESLNGDAELPVQVPLNIVPPSPDLEGGEYMSSELEPEMGKGLMWLKRGSLGSGKEVSFIPLIVQLIPAILVSAHYQWHSTTQKAFWVTFIVLSTLSEMAIGSVYHELSFDWGTTNLYKTYIRPLVSEHLRLRGESRRRRKWLGSSKEADSHNTTDSEPRKSASRRSCHDFSSRLVVAATFVSLLCHLGKIAIALTAFISAPDRIYNVPDVWILEVLGHVGG